MENSEHSTENSQDLNKMNEEPDLSSNQIAASDNEPAQDQENPNNEPAQDQENPNNEPAQNPKSEKRLRSRRAKKIRLKINTMMDIVKKCMELLVVEVDGSLSESTLSSGMTFYTAKNPFQKSDLQPANNIENEIADEERSPEATETAIGDSENPAENSLQAPQTTLMNNTFQVGFASGSTEQMRIVYFEKFLDQILDQPFSKEFEENDITEMKGMLLETLKTKIASRMIDDTSDNQGLIPVDPQSFKKEWEDEFSSKLVGKTIDVESPGEEAYSPELSENSQDLNENSPEVNENSPELNETVIDPTTQTNENPDSIGMRSMSDKIKKQLLELLTDTSELESRINHDLKTMLEHVRECISLVEDEELPNDIPESSDQKPFHEILAKRSYEAMKARSQMPIDVAELVPELKNLENNRKNSSSAFLGAFIENITKSIEDTTKNPESQDATATDNDEDAG